MSFQQGLSGLNASSKALDVIGNNVANSSTVGFKSSRAEFADVYAASLGAAGGAGQVGIGAMIDSVSQQFTQGNISVTNNSLDMAINGNGMYVMADRSGALSYTRHGQFHLDKDGYLINAGGLQVQGYPANYSISSLGTINSSTPQAIWIDPSDLQPQQTTRAAVGVNLDARSAVPPSGHERFDPADPLSYASSTSLTTYDSLGNVHTLSMYFIFDNTEVVAGQQISNWRVRYAIDGIANPTEPYPAVAPVPSSPWTVPVTALPVAVTGTATTSGYLVGGAYVPNSANAGGTLNLTVDGTPYAVSIPAGSYTDNNSLASALTTALSSAGAGAVASANSNGGITITSATTGLTSTVTDGGGGFSATVFGSPPFTAGDNLRLQFDTYGKLIGYNGAPGTLGSLLPAPTLTIDLNAVLGTQNKALTPLIIGPSSSNPNGGLDYTATTQFGTPFGVNSMTQDGYPSGRMAGLSVSAEGIIQGRYTNGQTRNMAQVVLARFTNPNGLMNIGGNQWQETYASGAPLVGSPGSASNGLIQSSAVEESNVDLTKELVDMITFQRAYQANAQTIKTQDSVLQTLVNLR